jgi:glycogen debranching enzyme
VRGLADRTPGATQTIKLRIQLREQGRVAGVPRGDTDLWATTRVESDCGPFDETLRRSLTDLRTLVSHQGGRAYLAAGAPWFVALFGRDSMLSALQSLAFEPRLARDTLVLLARHQGRRLDPVPRWLGRVRLEGLRVAGATVDLEWQRTGAGRRSRSSAGRLASTWSRARGP